MNNEKTKILILGFIIAITLATHYGWILDPIFGHTDLVRAIHGRLCYIPIALAASWFGLRGGVITASIISILVLPFIFVFNAHANNISSELMEIVFYYAIAILIGVVIDKELSLRKKQEETQLQLERAHKLSMIGQMAAGVAHEIKNPLASIKGAVEIISDPSTPLTEKKEFQEIVHDEIKRVDGTIKEFLEFARPKELYMEKLNLSSSLKTSIKQLENQAGNKNISFTRDIEKDVIIFGDKEKIHQVLLNLLLNALQASDNDSQIIVTLKKDEDNKSHIKIIDHGKGIEKSQLQKIFEPFYTSKPSGTGLGLAIVKSILEKHQGQINVVSEENKGTEIDVTLPLYEGKNEN
ncbi:MAG: DUF4118 domain-containing protein [FCB group bacterium]|nr:DUF4118 domain-containing protein [FCB group bacterium]